MNEEARKYIEDLQEKFEGECNCPSGLKCRQELLTTARHSTTISNEEFTKDELEYAAFKTNGSFEFGFYVGARWADEHQKSQWISVKDTLPPTDEKVLICVRKVWPSNAVINPKNYSIELSQRIGHVRKDTKRYVDKYGFPNHGYKEFEVIAWMPIPELPKGGGR